MSTSLPYTKADMTAMVNAVLDGLRLAGESPRRQKAMDAIAHALYGRDWNTLLAQLPETRPASLEDIDTPRLLEELAARDLVVSAWSSDDLQAFVENSAAHQGLDEDAKLRVMEGAWGKAREALSSTLEDHGIRSLETSFEEYAFSRPQSRTAGSSVEESQEATAVIPVSWVDATRARDILGGLVAPSHDDAPLSFGAVFMEEALHTEIRVDVQAGHGGPRMTVTLILDGHPAATISGTSLTGDHVITHNGRTYRAHVYVYDMTGPGREESE